MGKYKAVKGTPDVKKDNKPKKAAKALEAVVKISAKTAVPARPETKEKMSRKVYERELRRLHVELVKLQEWVKSKGLKVCVVFEGRDGAG